MGVKHNKTEILGRKMGISGNWLQEQTLYYHTLGKESSVVGIVERPLSERRKFLLQRATTRVATRRTSFAPFSLVWAPNRLPFFPICFSQLKIWCVIILLAKIFTHFPINKQNNPRSTLFDRNTKHAKRTSN